MSPSPYLALALAFLASACVSYGPLPPRVGPVSATVTSTWYSPLGRHHPLAGQIWNVESARFTRERDLVAALASARMVMLGENHDNYDHHRLQATLLRAMVEAGRHPAVAFEMLDTDEQQKVDDALVAAPRSSDAIARAVGWEKKGWPPWLAYAQIANVAIDRGLPIVAANLPLREVRAIARQGLGAIDAREADELGLNETMPDALAASLRDELVASHCGHLRGDAVERMALAQRARDGQMAARMLLAARGDGTVLIAGAGHARKDRGVPRALARRDAKITIASVAFVEVDEGELEPHGYAAKWHAATLPFDYVIFTPRASDEDACAQMRRK